MKTLIVLWVGYGMYIVYQVFQWIDGKHIAVNQEIYNFFYLKKIGIAMLLLGVSFVLHRYQKNTAAIWVAGVPAMIAGILLLLALFAWIFTWFVMWWGSK